MRIKIVARAILVYTLVPFSVFATELSQFETSTKKIQVPQQTSKPNDKVSSVPSKQQIPSTDPGLVSPLIFELNTRRTLKELNLQRRTGGGGVVDGGGGNYAGNQLLDIYQGQDLEQLSPQHLTDLIDRHQGDQVGIWSQSIPGFKNWLLDAIDLPWYLTSKPIDPEKCLSLSAEPSAVCFNFNSVIANKEALENLSEPQQAKMILNALFSYHINLRNLEQPRAEIRKRNQALEKLLSSAQNPQDLIRGLQRLNALPDFAENESFRSEALGIIQKKLESALDNLAKASTVYKDLPANMLRGCNQVTALIQNDLNACLKLSVNLSDAEKTCHLGRAEKIFTEFTKICGGR